MILLFNKHLGGTVGIDGYEYEGREIDHISHVSNVNILVGENNAGKSRFMRSIMLHENYLAIKTHALYTKYLRFLDLADTKAFDTGFSYQIMNTHIDRKAYSVKTEDFLNQYHETLFNEKQNLRFELENATIEDHRDKILIAIQTDNFDTSRILAGHFQRLELLLGIAIEAIKIYNPSRAYHVHSFDFPAGKSFSTLNATFRSSINHDVLDNTKEIYGLCLELKNAFKSYSGIKKIYIPILRSARTLYGHSNDKARLVNVFKDTINKTYSINFEASNIEIETGLDLYDSVKRDRNSLQDERKVFNKFQSFLSASFFNNSPVEIVARHVDEKEKEHIFISIADEEREIHYVGDGIQSLIMMLYPLFMAKDNSWVFIEEPETNLHPGFQRLFLETITTNEYIKAKNLVVFLTTHSNHLLDLTFDIKRSISIFTFQKNKTGRLPFSVEAVASNDLKGLNILGVQNSSVFLANCSIWVEGPTDRTYIKAYLKIALEKSGTELSLLEDLHYTFIEYGGSNIVHYSFEDAAADRERIEKIRALSISNRILLVVDADYGKDARHKRLAAQSSAKFRFIKLPVREIENLISSKILAEVLGSLSTKFDKAHLASLAFSEDDYKNEYLGTYLKAKYGAPNFPKSLTVEGGSGTLSPKTKIKLAELVADAVTVENISKKALKLGQETLQFILEHNPRLKEHLK